MPSVGRRSCSLVLASLFALACGGPPPASTDASTDAAHDARPPCEADGACDDGLFCNGAELCMRGVCVAGSEVLCSDFIDCTLDACSENVRACVSDVPDLDADGAGDARCLDASGTPLGVDCDDSDGNRFLGNAEICDAASHDEDCDASTHGASDLDADGFEDERCCNGDDCGDDCNDTRIDVHPGSTEVCNLVDDDCNGAVDEGVSITGFHDEDRDGYGDASRSRSACGTAPGFSPYGTDCADHLVARSPAQAEICDEIDNDCDEIVDEGASDVTWYADLDGDGFGSAASGTLSSCVPPAGYSLLGTDCDDALAGVSPAAAEVCDAIDNDCNGAADYVVTTGDLEDDDGDGVADSGCGGPRGVDCDDRDASSAPASTESCDGRDNDCDARVDEGATSVAFFRDADGDGFGSDATIEVACTQPAGHARRGGDCDDASTAIRPGSIETCDAVDQDCDGAVDEAEASSMCSLAHATSVCASGTCTFAACETGYADCSEAPGCESDVLGDALHCGSCAPCTQPGSTCALGSCRPVLAALSRLGSASTSDEIVNDVAVVPGTSDVIVVGAFRGTLSFGTTSLVSLGGLDGFAARVRPDGSAVWAQRWGGLLDDQMTAIGIEPTTNGLVLGGDLCGPVDLCGGPVGSSTRCLGFWQRFRSVSVPACDYATVLDGTVGANVSSLVMERSGGQTYVYVGGRVSGTSIALDVASTYDYDGFVARFSESVSATWEWTRLAISGYPDVVTDVALDAAGHVLAVGTADGGVDFGTGPQMFSGYSDPFVFSMTASTGVTVAGRFFGANANSYDTGASLVVDGASTYVAGIFGDSGQPSTLFAGAGGTVASNGGRDGYVVAFDTATLATRWAVAIGGAQDDALRSLSIVNGNVVAAGSFRDTIAIGSGSFVSDGGTDGIAVALDATGALVWARHARGPLDEVSVGTSRLADGSVVWLTQFGSAVSILDTALTIAAGDEVAVARLSL